MYKPLLLGHHASPHSHFYFWNVYIKERVRGCMYLHAEEKKKLFSCVWSIYTSYDTLMKRLYRIPSELICDTLFKEAQEAMLIIYQQICRREEYSWNIDTLLTCTQKLNTAIIRLKIEKEELIKAGCDYAEILKWAEICQRDQKAYNDTWTAINQFTKKNGKQTATVYRSSGSHAFNQKKVCMQSLLDDLNLLI